jgi:osmotically-inducible protein OsmY
MLRTIRLFMLVLFTSVIVACAGNVTHESTGQFVDSSAVTTKVKARLMDKLGADGFEIKVKTFKDEVQLSGFVNNAKTKKKAGAIASATPGVSSVKNDLIVK